MFTDHGRARVEVPVLLTDVEHVLEGTGLEDIAGCQMERAREALYLRTGRAVQAATGKHPDNQVERRTIPDVADPDGRLRLIANPDRWLVEKHEQGLGSDGVILVRFLGERSHRCHRCPAVSSKALS
jgi:hypothetical protein